MILDENSNKTALTTWGFKGFFYRQKLEVPRLVSYAKDWDIFLINLKWFTKISNHTLIGKSPI